MSVVSRQQRRAMQRKMSGLTSEQAERMITALHDTENAQRDEARKLAPGIVNDVLEKMKKDWEPVVREKVRNQTIGDILIMVMAFEHIDRRHTARYLVKWIKDFMEFADAVAREGSGVDGLKKILLEECCLDFEKEYGVHKNAETENGRIHQED